MASQGSDLMRPFNSSYKAVVPHSQRKLTCRYGDNVCYRTNLRHILEEHSENHVPATNPTGSTEGNIRIGFHQTHEKAASLISTGYTGFRCGTSGMFGGGIYFAVSIAETKHKAHEKGVILACKVDVGRVYQVSAACNLMTLAQLKSMGYDSLEARPHPGFLSTGIEFVVYEPWRVKEFMLVSTEPEQEGKLVVSMLSALVGGKSRQEMDDETRRRYGTDYPPGWHPGLCKYCMEADGYHFIGCPGGSG